MSSNINGSPTFDAAISEALRVLEKLRADSQLIENISKRIEDTLRSGNKILLCGNGGSGAHASHLATELVGHYRSDRRPFPAHNLCADGALLSCIGNDFSFTSIFARQVSAMARPNDLLIVFSTSGNSENILEAMHTARSLGVGVIALLGRNGGRARGIADLDLIVDSDDTARIQEGHQFLIHVIMDGVERALLSGF